MLTFDDRYRPLNAGAKFVYLRGRRRKVLVRYMQYIELNLHIKGVSIYVEFMANAMLIQTFKQRDGESATYFPIVRMSYGSCLMNWFDCHRIDALSVFHLCKGNHTYSMTVNTSRRESVR